MEEKNKAGAPITDAMTMMKGEEVPPELQKKMDSYMMALMHVVHSDETNSSVVEMLKSGPPEQSIPYASNQINGIVETSLKEKGKNVEDSVKMAGALYLVSDLIELGNVSKSWDTEIKVEEMPKYFQLSLQQYIQKGLKDGTIDPVELQAQTEPLMNSRQTEVGSTIAKELNLPSQPTINMGIDAYTKKKVAPLEEENKKLKSMLGR